jgi:hypothetical protein
VKSVPIEKMAWAKVVSWARQIGGGASKAEQDGLVTPRLTEPPPEQSVI